MADCWQSIQHITSVLLSASDQTDTGVSHILEYESSYITTSFTPEPKDISPLSLRRYTLVHYAKTLYD